MGVGVSGWRLAAAVARAGQLGVVSGTALDAVLARRLQRGDPGGHARRALEQLPLPGVAGRILARYFVPGGLAPRTPFRPVPRTALRHNQARAELTVAANFAEVYLAKEGHRGLVGVNYLEKIATASAEAAYGAMLAGVDYVLVGAGVPAQIPELLTELARQRPARLSVPVAGPDAGQEQHPLRFDPLAVFGAHRGPSRRPHLLAIVSSAVLAAYLVRSPATRPDGFVLEGADAGGHSAPPRGPLRLDEHGEPVYGERDRIDAAKVRALGLPFWLAGGYAGPRALAEAKAAGACGVQVGSAFALCEESDLRADLKREALARAVRGEMDVRADPNASPTGFPFKTAQLPGTLTEQDVYEGRRRLCDLGYLRTAYRTARGGIGYRCPAEPVEEYVAKGGRIEDTVGRRCLCNALTSTVGLGQTRAGGYAEAPLVTLGKDLGFLAHLLPAGAQGYSAADVIEHILAPS
ncbi:nitronate monooxygenase [Actinocrinis puniceicyclus]